MSQEQFAHTKDYQIKVLSLMLQDRDFCLVAKDALQHEHFSDKSLQWFFDRLSSSAIPLSPTTLLEELVEDATKGKIRKDEIDKFNGYYGQLTKRVLPIEQDHIVEKLSTFIKTQEVKKGFQEAIQLAKNEDWDGIIKVLTDAVNSGANINDKGLFYFETIEERAERRAHEQLSYCLPTGIIELDLLMKGLKQKQLGLIVGGTGRGKSLFMEYIGRTSILMNKSVVYYTLEMPEEDIASRYDSMFSQVPINDLRDQPDEVLDELRPMLDKYGNRLVIKEYPAGFASVDTIKAHLTQLLTSGFVPDIIFVDYLDMMRPRAHYHSRHEELDSITMDLHALAKETACPVWTATQLNRSGLGMDTPDETAIAGAVAKLYTCDVALFLAQTSEERAAEQMRIYISKSRNGGAGQIVQFDTDFSRMTFFRESDLELRVPSVGPGEIDEQERHTEEDPDDGYLDGVEGDEDLLIVP